MPATRSRQMRDEPIGHLRWTEGDETYKIALVWDRLGAGLVDWVVAALVGVVLGLAASVLIYVLWVDDRYALVDDSGAVYYSGGDDASSLFIWFIASLACVTIVHLAFASMVAWRGQTPGHRLRKLKIRSSDGRRLDWRRALLRELAGSPCVSLPYVLLIVLVLVNGVMSVAGATFDRSGVAAAWEIGSLFDHLGIIASVSLIGVPLMVMVNHVWMSRDALGQGLHDRLVGTVVVRELEDVD